MKDEIYDLELANRFSSDHKPELEKDQVCGCFYCLTVFSPNEITEWLLDESSSDGHGTAVCPYCGVDSVIGESSGFPITQEFLRAMHRRWFEEEERNV